jgi:hypothetical protein
MMKEGRGQQARNINSHDTHAINKTSDVDSIIAIAIDTLLHCYVHFENIDELLLQT